MVKKLLKTLFAPLILGLCANPSVFADLQSQTQSIIRSPSQKNVEFGVAVINAASGKPVYYYNAQKAMVPASNMKLVTTAAALEILGTDYKYRTIVGLQGETLVVTGSGDPLMGDRVTDEKCGRGSNWFFEDIAQALRDCNVSRIRDIIIDTSVFDDERVHPSWPADELNRHYACELSGLNFNGNCIDITAEKVGEKVVLELEPQTDYVRIINKVMPAGRGVESIWCSRQAGTNQITVRGECSGQTKPVRVTIGTPGAFLGFLLAENLTKAGIAVEGKCIGKEVSRNAGFRPIRVYVTPITEVVTRCNRDSFGLAAEALVKTVAAESSTLKKNGSWAEGRQILSRYLAKLGIGNDEFFIDDGSGLSAKNKLSANAITKVLFSVYRSNNWLTYKDSLSIGGVNGTAEKYFKEEKYKGKIFGKTGYLAGVKSFSGICFTEKGNYIFSILTNRANNGTRKAINDIAKAIIECND